MKLDVMRHLLIAIICCLTAGCGDSGSGSATGAGSTSTGGGATTGGGSAARNTGELKPDGSFQSIAASLLLTTDSPVTATSNRLVLSPGTVLTIGYDAFSSNYSLRDDQAGAAFSIANLTDEKSAPEYFPRVDWKNISANEVNYLTLFKVCNCTPAISVSSAVYGAWQRSVAQAGGTQTRLDYFINGSPSLPSALPTSGTSDYRYAGSGNYADDKMLNFVSESGTIHVDWSKGTVSLRLSQSFTDFISGSFGGLADGNPTVTATISGNTFSGPLTFAYGTSAGTLRGQFYGTRGQDIGIIYTASSSQSSFVGAAVGTTP